MQNDNLSEKEIKFIKDNFGSLKIPKEFQNDFLKHIKQYLTYIKEGRDIELKNWFGTRLVFSYDKEQCCFYIRKSYNSRSVVSKNKWMKRLAKSTLLYLKELDYKNDNKKFLEESIKITNDISGLRIDEPLNIPIVKKNNSIENICFYKILPFCIGAIIIQLIIRLAWFIK